MNDKYISLEENQLKLISYNGIKLKADRLYKRFGDGGLILADVSTSVFMVGINNN